MLTIYSHIPKLAQLWIITHEKWEVPAWLKMVLIVKENQLVKYMDSNRNCNYENTYIIRKSSFWKLLYVRI